MLLKPVLCRCTNNAIYCIIIRTYIRIILYVHTYVHDLYIAVVMSALYWAKMCFQPVISSVITATPMLTCSPVASQLYNITVTCTIHPNSTADQCVVMAMADGRVTRTGEICITQ